MLVHWSFDGFWLPSGIAEAARVTSLVENVAVPRCLHGGSPGVGDDFFIPVGWWGFKPWDILGWSLVVPYIERRNFARHLSKNWLYVWSSFAGWSYMIIVSVLLHFHWTNPLIARPWHISGLVIFSGPWSIPFFGFGSHDWIYILIV